MKKNDWLLIIFVLAVSILAFGFHNLRPRQEQAVVEVRVDGEEFGCWPLSEDMTVEIDGTNQLVIEDGQADMVWADCPDKLCVRQRAISREGESIICLPNKVVVSVVGGEEREVDAVTN